MSYREGQTATNPQTGQTIVFRGGQWVAAAPTGGSGPPRRLSAQDQAFLTDQREAALKAQEAGRVALEFNRMNRNIKTGEVWGVPGASHFSEPHQVMEAMTERMLPGMRVPGSGATSDRDMESYRKSVPSIGRYGNANTAIANTILQNARRHQDYVAFMENWAQQRGSLLGAQEAWMARQNQPRAAVPQSRRPAQSSAPAQYDAQGNRIR